MNAVASRQFPVASKFKNVPNLKLGFTLETGDYINWKLTYMDPIDNLTQLFKQFPGIGSRQAHRFVFFLLKKNDAYVRELSDGIRALRARVAECDTCRRFFVRTNESAPSTCRICLDPGRDKMTVLVVEKDSDLDAIERSGAYRGTYFVLGGTLPILDENPEERIRIRELLSLLSARAKDGLREIIIATAFTPESEHTADYVREKVTSMAEEKNIKLTTLGRGLSTGSELEYADSETLRYALEGRK